MYKLKNSGLKILKIIHLLGACCWIGGACGMLVLNINNIKATSDGMLYGLNMASHLLDMWIVVFFGVYLCILTGLIYGLMTPFGFIKFKWIIAKWIITIICFMSGWFLLGNYENEMLRISENIGISALENSGYLAIKSRQFILNCIQITLLVSIVAISVLRPWRRKSNGN